MRRERSTPLCILTVLCLCGLPAAGALFTDLGTGSSVYAPSIGWTVSGSFTAANLFTVTGVGSQPVSQIDLALSNFSGANTFYASIFTDSSGLPGVQVSGANWNPLSTSTSFGSCCGLVSITGITDVFLTGGQQYFMVLGPLSLSDSSSNVWNFNTLGVTGEDVFSNNGGATWTIGGSDAVLGGFDILSTPEPGSLLLLGSGLVGVGGAYRRRSSS